MEWAHLAHLDLGAHCGELPEGNRRTGTMGLWHARKHKYQPTRHGHEVDCFWQQSKGREVKGLSAAGLVASGTRSRVVVVVCCKPLECCLVG